jgi:hypothetical protein
LHVAAAVEAFFRKEGTSTRVEIELDSGETLEGVRFAIVSKTDPYTFLGHLPLKVAPSARIDTPLALTAFRTLDVVTLVAGAASVMRKGDFFAHRKGIDHRADVHRLIVRAPDPFAYQVDGDDAGNTQQLDIVYEPDALTIVVP